MQFGVSHIVLLGALVCLQKFLVSSQAVRLQDICFNCVMFVGDPTWKMCDLIVEQLTT